MLANPVGPTCHKGITGCFGDAKPSVVIPVLNWSMLLAGRKTADPAGTNPAKLYAGGTKRIAQKVGEEGVETALAATVNDGFEINQ